MRALQALVFRVQRFGLRRSAAVYLVIVVGLVLASEFAIDQIVVQGGDRPGFAVVNALAIAALVGVFVFFLFQGAVEDREQASVALANSEERFRSLTALSADWFWETDSEHRISWIAGGQSMLKLFGSELAYGRRVWEIPGIDVPEDALAAHLVALRLSGHSTSLNSAGRVEQGRPSTTGFPVSRVSTRRVFFWAIAVWVATSRRTSGQRLHCPLPRTASSSRCTRGPSRFGMPTWPPAAYS